MAAGSFHLPRGGSDPVRYDPLQALKQRPGMAPLTQVMPVGRPGEMYVPAKERSKTKWILIGLGIAAALGAVALARK